MTNGQSGEDHLPIYYNPGKFLFGTVLLHRAPICKCKPECKRFATVEGLYQATDPIRKLYELAVRKWCTSDEFLNVILEIRDPSLRWSWDIELKKFFSGELRKFGWEGHHRFDGETPLIRLFPTAEWDGKNIPEGIEPWVYPTDY